MLVSDSSGTLREQQIVYACWCACITNVTGFIAWTNFPLNETSCGISSCGINASYSEESLCFPDNSVTMKYDHESWPMGKCATDLASAIIIR